MSIHLSVVYTGNVSISTSVRVLFQKKMNASDACAQCKSKHHNKRKKKFSFFSDPCACAYLFRVNLLAKL